MQVRESGVFALGLRPAASGAASERESVRGGGRSAWLALELAGWMTGLGWIWQQRSAAV
jgi:hypothetical protein